METETIHNLTVRKKGQTVEKFYAQEYRARQRCDRFGTPIEIGDVVLIRLNDHLQKQVVTDIKPYKECGRITEGAAWIILDQEGGPERVELGFSYSPKKRVMNCNCTVIEKKNR